MTTRVAAVQAAPVYLDLRRSAEKAEALIAEAASGGVRLIAFPEAWLPGYPVWLDICPNVGLWDHRPTKQVYARLMQNCVVVPSRTTEMLAAAARAARAVVSIGVQERVESGPGRGTVYNTQLTFDTEGELVGRHRKIMPTFTERMIWGQGDGSSLHASSTAIGRVGALTCWEHWMPLARQALHESGEDFHVAAWPTVKDSSFLASRHYAFEGRCFVIAVGSVLSAADLPTELERPTGLRDDDLVMRGGSAIFGPDGAVLAGPAGEVEEILTADCDLSKIPEESLALDVAGHYSRPDVFEFRLR